MKGAMVKVDRNVNFMYVWVGVDLDGRDGGGGPGGGEEVTWILDVSSLRLRVESASR